MILQSPSTLGAPAAALTATSRAMAKYKKKEREMERVKAKCAFVRAGIVLRPAVYLAVFIIIF